jgi:hypothetical protein
MTMSPAERCGKSSAIAESTTAAGNISQIARGDGSCDTKLAMDVDPTAPASISAAAAAGCRS